MLIAVDVGNSNVHVGTGNAGALSSVERFPTRPDEPVEVLGDRLKAATPGRPDAVIICSVVLGFGERVVEASARLWSVDAVIASPSLGLGIRYDVPEPARIGTDRLVAAGEAFALARGAVVVVGVGTALTVDGVTGDGRFVGGTISPGLQTALASLPARTSLLPEVELKAPEPPPGRDTRSSILAGVVYGTAGAVDRLADELRRRVGEGARVVLTGGDAPLLSPYVRTPHRVEDHLVLRGLLRVWERLSKG